MVSLADALTSDFTSEEIAFISDHAAALGILMKTPSLDSFKVAPLSLLPSVFSATAVASVTAAQGIINQMTDRIARNTRWLHELIEPIAETDEFTRNLLKISKVVHAEGLRQTKFLGFLRSDYMMDAHSNKPLQVEINTISSAFGALSTRLRDLHQIVLERFSHKFVEAPDIGKLASVTVFQSIAKAFVKAVRAYGSTGVILLVVEENDRNVIDQLPLGIATWRDE
jgi:hypothetical protein